MTENQLGLIPAFAAIVSIVSGWQGYRQYVSGKAALRWRPVSGTITHSEAYNRRESRRTMHYAEIRYTYIAVGRQQEGNVVFFGHDGSTVSTEAKAQELVAKYPVGAAVTVFVDPTQQGEAVLEPGVSSEARRAIGFAIGSGVIALVFTYGLVFGIG